MSDHWNSLANLLGTPSIDPLQRKSTRPSAEAGEKKPPEISKPDKPAQSQSSTQSPSILETNDIDPVKVDPPSRIRASWDAVARLFGVAAPEPVQNPFPDPPDETRHSSAGPSPSSNPKDDDLFSGFRGRSNKNRSSSNDSSSRSEAAPRTKDVPEERIQEPRRRDEPIARTAPPAASKSTDSTSGRRRPPSLWDSSPDEASPPVEARIQDDSNQPEVSETHSRRVSERPSRREEADDATLGSPERRGRRRNIRRGRSESSVEEVQLDKDSTDSIEVSEDLPRTERPERSERPQRQPRERTGRGPSDRQERGERTDRAARPQRGERPERASSSDRPDRSERSPSAGRSDRAPSADRGRRGGRDLAESNERNRDTRREEPKARALPERDLSDDWEEIEPISGFGSGIIDDEPLLEPNIDSEEEGGKRRRRRRGRRGRKTTDETRESEVGLDDVMTDDRQAYGQHMSDDDDSDMATERLTKITSWLDAISPMIEANMANHKKSSGDNRGGRGSHGGGGGGRGRGGPRRGPNSSGNR